MRKLFSIFAAMLVALAVNAQGLIPSTDFAAPGFYCSADAAVLSGTATDLDGKFYLDQTATPHHIAWSDLSKAYTAVASWTFTASRGCYVTVTLDLGPVIASNKHIFDVELLDMNGNILDTIAEGPNYTGDGFTDHDQQKTLDGQILIPAAGTYKLQLKNNRDWCKGSIKNVILTYAADLPKPQIDSVVYNWAKNANAKVGITTLGRVKVSESSVKIHSNKDAVDALKFEKSYSDSTWAIIKPATGKFLAGDSIVFAGAINNSDAAKWAMVDFYGADTAALFRGDSLINGQLSAADPKMEGFKLAADQDSIFLGRYGNTNMFVTLLKVLRKVDAPDPVNCDSIYKMAKGNFVMMNPVTVTYSNGANVWVKDETASMLIYLPSGFTNTFKAGDVLTGVAGTIDIYQNVIFEVKPSADEAAAIVATAGEAPVAIEVVDSIAVADINNYVVLKNVAAEGAFTTESKTSINATIGEKQVTLYNNFKFAYTFEAGKNYDVTGVVSAYKGAPQVYFISAEEIAAPQPAPSLIDTVKFFMNGDSWTPDTISKVTWDGINEKVIINIIPAKHAQWQGQLWLKLPMDVRAGYEYDLAFKVKSDKSFEGTIVKYQENAEMLIDWNMALVANEELAYEKKNMRGLENGNGVLVIDFGFAPDSTNIEVYEISIVEHEATAPLAKFYVTGNDAFTVDAGKTTAESWHPDAFPCYGDTLAVALKAGAEYQLKVCVDGSWNTAKNYNDLTEKAAGLIDADGNNHNIGFKLAADGDVQIIYTAEVFKLIGNFLVEGLDNTNAEVKAIKVLRNGQIFIEKNGKTYNVLGVTIK